MALRIGKNRLRLEMDTFLIRSERDARMEMSAALTSRVKHSYPECAGCGRLQCSTFELIEKATVCFEVHCDAARRHPGVGSFACPDGFIGVCDVKSGELTDAAAGLNVDEYRSALLKGSQFMTESVGVRKISAGLTSLLRPPAYAPAPPMKKIDRDTPATTGQDAW